MINVAGMPWVSFAITDPEDTFFIVDDKLVSTVSSDVQLQSMIDAYDPLPAVRISAIETVNAAAEIAREKVVSRFPTQTTVYRMKFEDAEKFMQAGYPQQNIGDYPFVLGETLNTGFTGQQVADSILNKASQWVAIVVAIENQRRKANLQIMNELQWDNCDLIAQQAANSLQPI